MSNLATTFPSALAAVRARIAEACTAARRDPAGVRLLPVTKNQPAEAVALAAAAGFEAVGENRVQEAIAKQTECAAQGLRVR